MKGITHRISAGTAILVALAIVNVGSLALLYFLRYSEIISEQQYYYAYMIVLVCSAIISSVLKLPSTKFNQSIKVALTSVLLLVLALLAVLVSNTFWQWSTLAMGTFGMIIVLTFWIVGFVAKRSSDKVLSFEI